MIKLINYMAFLIKCCIMKLPEIRKKKNKGKYTVTTKDDEKKYTYQNITKNIDVVIVKNFLFRV